MGPGMQQSAAVTHRGSAAVPKSAEGAQVRGVEVRNTVSLEGAPPRTLLVAVPDILGRQNVELGERNARGPRNAAECSRDAQGKRRSPQSARGGGSPWFGGAEHCFLRKSASPCVAIPGSLGHCEVDVVEGNAFVALKAAMATI